MENEDEENFFKLAYIIVNIVAETFREVFKTEWDKRYPTMPWSDDVESLNNYITKSNVRCYSNRRAKSVNRPSMSIDAFDSIKKSNGRRDEWDIPVSGYALLHSNALDLDNSKPTLSAIVRTQMRIRNEIMHSKKWSISTADFNIKYNRIETDMKCLALQYGIDHKFCNQVIAIKNKTKLPTVNEFQKVKQALESERRDAFWQSFLSVTTIVVVFIAVITALLKFYDIQSDFEDLRESLQPPSEDDKNLMKQFLSFARSQHKYIYLQVFGVVIIFMINAYLWLRVYSIELKCLSMNIAPSFPDQLEPTYFYGRSLIIDRTINSICEGAKFTVFAGHPGIGKTATAVVIGKALRDMYNYVISFVDVKGMLDIKRVSEKIFKCFLGEYRDFNIDSFYELFQRRLTKKTLLIIDNADDIFDSVLVHDTRELLTKLVKQNANIHIILTTRENIDSIGDYLVTLTKFDRLDEVTSRKLLLTSCPALAEKEFSMSATIISEKCRGVPLLLNITSKLLKGELVNKKAKRAKIVDTFIEKLPNDNVLEYLREDEEIDKPNIINVFAKIQQDNKKLYDIKTEIALLRESLHPPSENDLNLMKEFLKFARLRNQYLILLVSVIFLICSCLVFSYFRVGSVQNEHMPAVKDNIEYQTWNLVPDFPESLIPDFFRGRKSLILQTENEILDGAVFTVFAGCPGIGKTVTAVVVGKELRDRYSFVVSFIEVRGMIDISMVAEKIFKSFLGNYQEYNDESFDDFFRRRLTKKTLIIIDNAEDILIPEMVKDTKCLLLRIVKYNTNIHVILTSRKRIDNIGDYDVSVRSLNILDLKTSIDVLTSESLCPDLLEDNFVDKAHEIAKRCSGVPLLLSLAGIQLKHDLRHAKTFHRKKEVISMFVENLQKDSVLVTLNKDDEIDERSMMHCINVLFSRIEQHLQETFIALSVFQVSFSDTAAETIVPGSLTYIPELLDYSILSAVYISVDNKTERYSIHPLLQEFATSNFNDRQEVKDLIKRTEERFYAFFIHEIQRIANRFFSEAPGVAFVRFSEDDNNFRKTLMNALEVTSLFESFYEMLVSAADLFLFGFDDKLISSFFDYAAENAKQRKDKARYMALLFLQGDRGDVFYYHHKDKYNKIQKLVDLEVEMIVSATFTLDDKSTRETAFALCVKGRVLALYPSRAGWTKYAEKIDNFEVGKSLIQDAISLLDSLGLLHDKAMVLSLLGLIQKNKRQYNDAIKSYKEALKILTSLYEEHALIGAIHFNIGYMYYKLGRKDFFNGTKEFIKSYEVYEKTIGDHKRTASAMFHAGECLNMYGKLEDSLPYFENAFQIQNRVAPRDRDTAETLMSIAEVNYKLGKYKTALPYFEKCLKVMTYKGVMSHPKHREIGYAYKGFANCLRKLYRIDDARINYNIALDIFKFVFETHNRCKEEIISINSILTEISV